MPQMRKTTDMKQPEQKLNKGQLDWVRKCESYLDEVKQVSRDEFNDWFKGKKTVCTNILCYLVLLEDNATNFTKNQENRIAQLRIYLRSSRRVEEDRFDKWFETREKFCNNVGDWLTLIEENE